MGQVAAKEQYSESETDTEVEEEALGVDHLIILRGGGVGVGEFKKNTLQYHKCHVHDHCRKEISSTFNEPTEKHGYMQTHAPRKMKTFLVHQRVENNYAFTNQKKVSCITEGKKS